MAHEREADVERTIVFSDGVVAIAITLLILPLTEIHPAEHATLADIVVENSAALGAFALSFAVIANYWTIHRDLFGPLRRYNRRIGLLNMFWLAAIVFLPFPTALIADGIDGGFAAFYIGMLLAVSVLTSSSRTTSPITRSSPIVRRRLRVASMSSRVPSVLAQSLSP